MREGLLSGTLGPFQLIERLGAGGMGVVYLAEDTRLRRRVALKVLPPDLVAEQEHRTRLLREARSAAAVSHPRIATVYEVGEADGHVFIAMEYVRGESLRQRLRQGPLALHAALDLARDVAGALAKAHDAGVTHRNLKPDNVMIDEEGHAKVLDFGLAKIDRVGRENADTTTSGVVAQSGAAMGTPGYASPEQAQGKPTDARSDVFGFGAMLYEMLSGRRRFPGASFVDLALAMAQRAPPPLHSFGIPAPVARIVDRCLALDPQARFQNGGEVLAALNALAGGPERLDRGATQALTPSIAVLPFVDMSPEKDHEYFSDGLAEELISRLTNLPGLRVTARTSSFWFKRTPP